MHWFLFWDSGTLGYGLPTKKQRSKEAKVRIRSLRVIRHSIGWHMAVSVDLHDMLSQDDWVPGSWWPLDYRPGGVALELKGRTHTMCCFQKTYDPIRILPTPSEDLPHPTIPPPRNIGRVDAMWCVCRDCGRYNRCVPWDWGGGRVLCYRGPPLWVDCWGGDKHSVGRVSMV